MVFPILKQLSTEEPVEEEAEDELDGSRSGPKTIGGGGGWAVDGWISRVAHSLENAFTASATLELQRMQEEREDPTSSLLS